MTPRLNLAITCFPTVGGSGTIATEVGLAMAAKGHRVHFIARDLPARLKGAAHNVQFHEVVESASPVLLQSSAYPIALASKMIEVAQREELDVIHVHYAIPHATAAWMAREVLGIRAPRIVTTLHGTDITLVGIEPNHLPITRFSVIKSDAVTTPSQFLKDATYKNLDIPRDVGIDVIPNFVDAPAQPLLRGSRPHLERIFPGIPSTEVVLFHVSNFRAVKRIHDVTAIFEQVAARIPCRLVMVGDGPDRAQAEQRLKSAGLAERVAFLGKLDQFNALLAEGDVFLLPSETESFGLAALEAMACGIPVVASAVGGIPEVVVHGETGWLEPLGDTQAMAQRVLSLVEKPAIWTEFSQRARQRALEQFQRGPAVERYEAVYRRVLATR